MILFQLGSICLQVCSPVAALGMENEGSSIPSISALIRPRHLGGDNHPSPPRCLGLISAEILGMLEPSFSMPSAATGELSALIRPRHLGGEG
jgi:hypothetical protein